MPKISREMDFREMDSPEISAGQPGYAPGNPGTQVMFHPISRMIHFPATTPPALPADQSRRHPGGSDGYWVGATRVPHSPGESIDLHRRRDDSDRVAS